MFKLNITLAISCQPTQIKFKLACLSASGDKIRSDQSLQKQ